MNLLNYVKLSVRTLFHYLITVLSSITVYLLFYYLPLIALKKIVTTVASFKLFKTFKNIYKDLAHFIILFKQLIMQNILPQY